jgi:hypothetical protein
MNLKIIPEAAVEILTSVKKTCQGEVPTPVGNGQQAPVP